MRKFLALVLALVMTMSLVTVSAGAATDFTDDAKITNVEAVEVLNAIGVLGGYADGSFRPQATLTRGAGAKLIAYLMLGQEKADALKATYTVFADVTDTVGLAPYIEWAAANGIVGGYGDGNFGPYNTLTEYAFGKMLLTAIGYDAEEQGYVGAGWQKAVYRDAIAKDIYTGTESYGACTRDTAAAMTLATLKTNYVVYGEKAVQGDFTINGVNVGIDWDFDFWGDWRWTTVTTNGAFDIPVFVWETYGDLIYNDEAADKWGNPGVRWLYDDEEIGFYEDEVVVTYTEQVDYCDLLVDLGVAVNSNDEIGLEVVYNGDIADTEVDGQDDTDYYVTATYATVEHDTVAQHCDDRFVGGQGVLTKVFDMGDDNYLVTEVATYLAKVTDVTKNHGGFNTEFTVYYRDLALFGETVAARDLHTDRELTNATDILLYDLTEDYAEDYAEDDFVLMTVEIEDDGDETIDAYTKITGTVGKLNGAKSALFNSPEVGTTKVDTTDIKDAFGFKEGYNFAKTPANWDSNRVFFYDTYGNVIGNVELEVADNYAVLESIWSDHAAGVPTVGASLYTFDGNALAGVNVAEFNNTDAEDVNTFVDGTVPARGNDTVMEIAAQNAAHLYRLYTYSVTDGDYTVNYADAFATDLDGNATSVTREDVDDELHYYDAVNGLQTIELTAQTQILVRDVNDNYKAYVGFQNLPMLTAAYAEVIWNDDYVNTEADIVYLHGVTFDSDKVLGYLVDTDNNDYIVYDGDMYYEYLVYVDGAKRAVYVEADSANNAVINGTGIYEIQFNAEDGLLVVNNIVKYGAADGFYADETVTYVRTSADTLKISVGAFKHMRLDLAKVYLVDETSHGTIVEAGDYTDLAVNDTVDFLVDDGEIVAIYKIID